MTYEELIATVSEKTGEPKCGVRETLEAAFKLIGRHAAGGGRILVPGLGLFEQKKQKARKTRLPDGSASVRLAPRTSIRFYPDIRYRRRLGKDEFEP